MNQPKRTPTNETAQYTPADLVRAWKRGDKYAVERIAVSLHVQGYKQNDDTGAWYKPNAL